MSDATQSRHAFRRKHAKLARNPSKVDTTFFKCGLDLFESRLMYAYRQVDDRQVDDSKRIFIEHMYLDQFARRMPVAFQ